MKHELKCWPEYYDAIACGDKPFEIRKWDRPYQVGDVLFLRRYDPELQDYTGEEMRRKITYLLDLTYLPGNNIPHFAGYAALGLDSPQTADLIESLQAQLAASKHKKGEWVRCRGEILNWECSACGFQVGEPWHDPNILGRLAYCSHCGCEMPAADGPRLKAEEGAEKERLMFRNEENGRVYSKVPAPVAISKLGRYEDAEEEGRMWIASPKLQATTEALFARNAEWKKDGEYPWLLNCSVCGDSTERGTNYCPNCGAKMEAKA